MKSDQPNHRSARYVRSEQGYTGRRLPDPSRQNGGSHPSVRKLPSRAPGPRGPATRPSPSAAPTSRPQLQWLGVRLWSVRGKDRVGGHGAGSAYLPACLQAGKVRLGGQGSRRLQGGVRLARRRYPRISRIVRRPGTVQRPHSDLSVQGLRQRHPRPLKLSPVQRTDGAIPGRTTVSLAAVGTTRALEKWSAIMGGPSGLRSKGSGGAPRNMSTRTRHGFVSLL
jgi:hypothetical protein